MNFEILIGNRGIDRNPFQGSSPFYPAYTFHISGASELDIAAAIGSARKADRSNLSGRVRALRKAAEAFSFSNEHLEHTVCMTGIPVTLLKELFSQIPGIFRAVPEFQGKRFRRFVERDPQDLEILGPNLFHTLIPTGGFCYAITPGNDPRSTALVAANLGYLGIPFIVRASIRDAAAPLVIKALIAGGFDPNFCNLIYIDRADPEASQKHFKLVDSASIVWTFGPAKSIDSSLRYTPAGKRAVLDLTALELESAGSEGWKAFLNSADPAQLLDRLRLEETTDDHFAGKTILRHEAGNCATVICGSFDPEYGSTLWDSTRHAIACTATKSAMVVDGPGWARQFAEFVSSLVTGDPLDEATQVGFILPRDLDQLQELLRANQSRITVFGGNRLSPIQAAPLVVSARENVPDFFAQEIPAYVLGVRELASLAAAVEQLNSSMPGTPRLAVSFINVPGNLLLPAILDVKAHAVMVDKPTTTFIPTLHEGNDYIRLLSEGKLLVV